MMELSLAVWEKYISFVFLASVYARAHFQSTSQQAIMPLSDMADLHVSEFPRGREGA